MDTIRQHPGQGGALAGFGGRFSPQNTTLGLGLLGRFWSLILQWQERAGQRHALAELDDRMLKDIGLNRAEVAHEIDKPFWRA